MDSKITDKETKSILRIDPILDIFPTLSIIKCD
jgi:hypothetical protein